MTEPPARRDKRRLRTPYGPAFFDDVDATGSASLVVPRLLELASPHSVLDVGCGRGSWLAAFRARGVDDVLGVDGAWVTPESADIPPQALLHHDLTTPLDLGRRFDLVLSLEVAEHLPAEAASTVTRSIARHGDLVAFSAAVPGQGGTHHVNEQWPSYWVGRFADLGFELFDFLRPAIWEEPAIRWWYRQNLLLFARGEEAARLRDENEGLPDFAGRPVVHPARLPGGSALGARELLHALPGALLRSARARLARGSGGASGSGSSPRG